MLRRQKQIRTQIRQIVDICIFGVSLGLAHWLRSISRIEVFGGSAEIQPFAEYVWLYAIILPFAPLLLESQGFYSRALLPSRRTTAWQLLKTCALAVMGVILVMFIFKIQLARSVIIVFGVISFVLVMLKEELVRIWLVSKVGQAQLMKRLIVIGTKDDTERLRLDLERLAPHDMVIPAQLDLNEFPLERLVDLMHEHSANGVIISPKRVFFEKIERVIQLCEREGVEVWLLADFFKTQISLTSLDDFFGRPMLVFRCGPEASWQRLAKDVLDVGGAFLLVVLLTFVVPFLPLVALWLKLGSPGPVFFRQQRSGLNGRPFTMLKFRTMVSNAEQLKQELAIFNEMEGPVFKLTNDPRVTPIGRCLRKWSIDEWPQLFNVLRGEMSLVGPRPLPVDEVQRFDDPAHRRRLSVKPGITCLWQVSGRNEVRDFKEWVRLDLEYIDHWSLWLDIKILLRTIPAVFLGTGAR